MNDTSKNVNAWTVFPMPDESDREISRCSCGRRMCWIETANGKKMPLSMDGAMVQIGTGRVFANSHFAECSDRETKRKR